MKRSSVIFIVVSFLYTSLSAQNVFEAARSGDVARIEFLMTLNPDTISTYNENGFSPLIIASYRNQVKVVEFLLSKGVDVNADSPEGTALIGSCYKGNIEIAKLLLEHKATINAQNEQGTTPLIFAVQGNNVSLVSLLVTSGANKEMKEKSGRTAMDYAKEKQNQEILDILSK